MAASSLPTAGEKPAQEKPNVGGGGVGAGKHKSKAYNSALAIRSDAAKYRAKYKDLKKQVLAVEAENDRMHATTLRHKRNIQRMRLERAYVSASHHAPCITADPLGYSECYTRSWRRRSPPQKRELWAQKLRQRTDITATPKRVRYRTGIDRGGGPRANQEPPPRLSHQTKSSQDDGGHRQHFRLAQSNTPLRSLS